MAWVARRYVAGPDADRAEIISCAARTIRRWRNRSRRGGIEGLVPTYPRHRPRRVSPVAIEWIRHARLELGYGAARTRLWLQRMHGIRLAMGTIQRIFRDLGVPRLRRTASGNRVR